MKFSECDQALVESHIEGNHGIHERPATAEIDRCARRGGHRQSFQPDDIMGGERRAM